jgi:hypothetical protein
VARRTATTSSVWLEGTALLLAPPALPAADHFSVPSPHCLCLGIALFSDGDEGMPVRQAP